MCNLKLLIAILILSTIFLVSCQDALVGSKPKPQPIEPETVVELAILNETNETETTTSIESDVFIPRDNNLTVFFLDVKGSSSIIQYKDNSALVDSGFKEDSEKILKSIRNLGIDTLDYVFATNTQTKNIGGMPYIILRTEPNIVVESGIPSNLNESVIIDNLMQVKGDISFNLDKAILKVMVVYDDGSGFAENQNDNSLIIKASYGNMKILLMSDCGFDCEERLRETDLSANILKISNSCDATSLAFLQKVRPEVAIISTQDSDFCPQIVSNFKYLDIPLYNTMDGDIFVTTDGLDYKVGQKKE